MSGPRKRPPQAAGSGRTQGTRNGRLAQANPSTIPRQLRGPVVADRLGVSVRTLEDWRNQGTGPPFRRLGRAVVYDEQTLGQWIAEQPEYTSTAAAEMAV